ncbi:MAG: putative metal-binding motif-containing protein [Deltaproteobacteria bacterium]|nr:putative metal-binding motif-containing protein [Deltaproteobacteria bacterium]
MTHRLSLVLSLSLGLPTVAWGREVVELGTDASDLVGAAALAGPDGVVLLPGGLWEGCLSLTEPLTLLALDPTDRPVLRCTGGPVIQTTADLSLRGIDLEDSGGGVVGIGAALRLTDVGLSRNTAEGGAAVSVDGGSLVIEGGVLVDNAAELGGALYVTGGAIAVLEGVALQGNRAGMGGAIFLDGGAKVALYRCLLVGNTGSAGGAIRGEGASLTVRDSQLLDNIAGDSGGAMSLFGGDAVVARSQIQGNYAVNGGGIWSSGDLHLSDSALTGNTAEAQGGGAWMTGGALSAAGCQVSDNTAGGQGGGLWLGDGIQVRGSAIAENSADEEGGGVFSEATVLLEGTSLTLNQGRSGGAIYAGAVIGGHVVMEENTAALDGGAVYSEGLVGLRSSRLLGNTATSGAGGAIRSTHTKGVDLLGVRLEDNQAGSAGGAVAVNTAVLDQPKVRECQLRGNHAGAYGGAVAITQTEPSGSSDRLLLTSTVIERNTSGNAGGGLYLDGAGLDADGVWVRGNTAPGPGGGIWARAAGDFTLNHAVLCHNTAAAGGGVYLSASRRRRTILHSVFQENVAGGMGGALYEGGIASTAGTTASLRYLTVAGNRSLSGQPYDGVVADTVGGPILVQEVWESLFVDNGLAALASVGTDNRHQVYGTVFWGQPAGYHESISVDDRCAGWQGCVEDPQFTRWILGDGCENDDLSTQLSYLGYVGSGVGADAPGEPDASLYSDQDGDGYTEAQGDCDDEDPTVYPSASEVRGDGVDQDCAEGDPGDQDGDGFLAWSGGGTDCDDTDPAIHPGAAEVWYDGVDQDCDGNDADADLDGAKAPPLGQDCDDADPAVHPGAVDDVLAGIDSDCDGAAGDLDGDGFVDTRWGGTDCDDRDDAVNPAAAEVWYDGVDQNCDGRSDDDADGDGYEALGGVDCDDSAAWIYPGAPDAPYDGVDADCGGEDDYDFDGDGFLPLEFGGADCDDQDAARNPAMRELHDGVDNDCDGLVDPDGDGDEVLDPVEVAWGLDPLAWDSDGDGLPDGLEWGVRVDSDPLDSDGDGTIDALDLDSDDDGLTDEVEGAGDRDADRIEDFRDPDDDGDGLSTEVELPWGDVDGDGQPCWADLDSDGDGALDAAEGDADRDGDGVPDWVDGGRGEGGHPAGPGDKGGACAAVGPSALGWTLWSVLLLWRRRRDSVATG